MERVNKQLYEANVELVDKNKYLELEVERLNNIIESAIIYIEKMSFGDIVNNPKNDLIKILKKEK